MECIAIGDSIALGIGQAAKCSINAKIGASSSYIADHTVSRGNGVAVISAGSNDPDNPRLAENLKAIRNKIKARRVVWILPYHRRAAREVMLVAGLYGDGYINLARFATGDGVHPKSYSAVAKQLK